MLILLFSGNFSYTYWFLCNLLLYLPLATDIWWVSVIFNFIWPVLTDIGLIFKFLIFSPWKITFCWKNILPDTFSRGYPVWKCELWLDLSNKTQKYNSAGCDHELHIVGEQPTDYYILTVDIWFIVQFCLIHALCGILLNRITVQWIEWYSVIAMWVYLMCMFRYCVKWSEVTL